MVPPGVFQGLETANPSILGGVTQNGWVEASSYLPPGLQGTAGPGGGHMGWDQGCKEGPRSVVPPYPPITLGKRVPCRDRKCERARMPRHAAIHSLVPVPYL